MYILYTDESMISGPKKEKLDAIVDEEIKLGSYSGRNSLKLLGIEY